VERTLHVDVTVRVNPKLRVISIYGIIITAVQRILTDGETRKRINRYLCVTSIIYVERGVMQRRPVAVNTEHRLTAVFLRAFDDEVITRKKRTDYHFCDDTPA
jgi:hypothetical protein